MSRMSACRYSCSLLLDAFRQVDVADSDYPVWMRVKELLSNVNHRKGIVNEQASELEVEWM